MCFMCTKAKGADDRDVERSARTACIISDSLHFSRTLTLVTIGKRAMATHTADERFTPVKRGVANLDIWVMVAFAVITIWVLFFV